MQANSANIRPCGAPTEEIPAEDYALLVNGQAVFTYRARVSAYPVNEYWPDHQRPLDQTEIASFASWEMDGAATVEVRCAQPITSAKVSPRGAGITPEIDGDTIRFEIPCAGQYVLEVNGWNQALHLFANPFEENAPIAEAEDVLYFGPGVHCPGIIQLESNQTLYLAAGAVVYGAVFAQKAQNITIRGRGVLDGSCFAREALTGLVCLHECQHVTIEGVVLRDAGGFSMVPMACQNMQIRNIKIIGNWRYNSDGIDFMNCEDCIVEDCFIRTFDDSLCVKGYETFGKWLYRLRPVDGDPLSGKLSVDGVVDTFAGLQRRFGEYPCPPEACRNIQVRRCVIWCDWGRPLEIGAETAVDRIEKIVFEDCDLIRTHGCAVISIQNGDRAACRNLTFRNIRVDLDEQQPTTIILKNMDQDYQKEYGAKLPVLFMLVNRPGCVWTDTVRGSIADIQIENIDVRAPFMPASQLIGAGDEHLVKDVRVRNLRLNGTSVTDLDGAKFQMNEFVRDIEIS